MWVPLCGMGAQEAEEGTLDGSDGVGVGVDRTQEKGVELEEEGAAAAAAVAATEDGGEEIEEEGEGEENKDEEEDEEEEEEEEEEIETFLPVKPRPRVVGQDADGFLLVCWDTVLEEDGIPLRVCCCSVDARWE